MQQGKTVCRHNAMHQDVLTEYLLNMLREAVLAGGHQEALRERLRARFAESKAIKPAAVASMKARLVDLEHDRDRLVKLIRRAPEEAADELMKELASVRRQRDQLASEFASIERANGDASDVDREVDAAMGDLWSLHKDLESNDPPRLREAIRRMVGRIDLHFGQVQRGKRMEYPFSHGEVELRAGSVVSGLDISGDWI